MVRKSEDCVDDNEGIKNLVDDIWIIMEFRGLLIADIADMWDKPFEVVEQFLHHYETGYLTLVDLVKLATILDRRLVVSFE